LKYYGDYEIEMMYFSFFDHNFYHFSFAKSKNKIHIKIQRSLMM